MLTKLRAEITSSILIAFFIVGMVGSLIGSSVMQTDMFSFRSKAADTRGDCWAPCSGNKDCFRTDHATGVKLACNMTMGYCLPQNGEDRQCQGAPPGLGNCGDKCRSDSHCNDHDEDDSSILLGCSSVTFTCQERRPNAAKQCPNYTPRVPSVTGEPPEGDDFIAHSGKCWASFRVREDPIVSRIALKQANSSELFELEEADLVVGSSTGHKSPIGYRMWRSYTEGSPDSVRVEWDPATEYGQSGVPKGSVSITLHSGGHEDVVWDVDNILHFYYWENLPTWIQQGEAIQVLFEYIVPLDSGRDPRLYKQSVSAQSCPPLSPTISPTPTPTVTNQPSITPLPSPTPSPTGVPCNADIVYVLDISSTMSHEGKLENAKQALVNASPRAGTRYKLLTFDKNVQYPVREFVEYEQFARVVQNIQHGEGTATLKAITAGRAAVSGGSHLIFITDGVPSYDSNECYYPNTFEMSDIIIGAKAPDEIQNATGDLNLRSETRSDACKDRRYGYPLAEIMRFAQGAGGPIHTISIGAGGGAYNDEILKYVANRTGGIYRSTNALSDAIDAVIASVCKMNPRSSQSASVPTSTIAPTQRVETPTTRPTAYPTNPPSTRQPTSIPSQSPTNPIAYTIAGYYDAGYIFRNTSSQPITQIRLKICNKDSSICSESVKDVSIRPGEEYGVQDSLPIYEVIQNDAYVTCDVVRDDGSVEMCPAGSARVDDGSKSTITVSNSHVTGTITPYELLGDQNSDGTINAVDVALTLSSYGLSTPSVDLNVDGVIDALDLSLVIGNLGKTIVQN